jgi:arthrofactin-type cyclic lipopeptide synthetase C
VSVTAQAGLCNTLLWSHGGLGIGPDDRVLCKASLSFDVVLWEMFAPLLCGGTLLLAPPFAEKDPWLLAEAMEQLRPTTIQFVPSFMKLFMDHAPLERLQGPLRIVLAGEALLPDLRERIHTQFPQAEVWSLYGPSEASVYVTAWRSEASRTDIRAPLGQPIANMQVHLLDDEGGVADPGETGEICLAGVGLSAGYLNQEEENARRFVIVRLSGRDLRVYRTGDFGRLGSDGVLEFAGRRDAQVKVRGNRVELGEVEACLERHPAVAIAALLAVDGATRLVAFVEFRPGMSLDTGELHTHLTVQLPSYMVPSQFHILDQVPRTIAGKIDRVKLQALANAAEEQEDGSTADR